MSTHHDPRPTPRNGHTLVVAVVARISGCANQKEMSLDDQIDHCKEVVNELFDGPVEYRYFRTTGKGERLDRPELAELAEMIRTRELDLMVTEDLGRFVRGTAAKDLCGIAFDHGTRVIASNDCIDTAEDSWEEDVISACRDHVGHNSHTSKRLKKKLQNRFVKHGGAVPLLIFGYVKKEGSKTYDGWRKDPEAVDVMQEWFRMLEARPNCSAVADMLNEKGVPTGKYARRSTWDGAMVRRITANPLLKGTPGRGFKVTVKNHESGIRVSKKNEKGANFLNLPHLMHIEPARFDEVNALLIETNKKHGRKPVKGIDPLTRVPRNRSAFPGQHARCWYCGRLCVWGGNGVLGHLMCNSSREYRCWNSLGFSGAKLAGLVAAAVFVELAKLDGFDEQLRELVESARRNGGGDLAKSLAELDRREIEVARQERNLQDAIAECGPTPLLKERLTALGASRTDVARQRTTLESRRKRELKLPGSIAELRALFEAKFQGLAQDSIEFGDLLRLVAPEIHVFLVRFWDDSHLMPRARVKLNLAGLVPDAKRAPEVEALLTKEIILDLFDPPQRERIRLESVRREAQGLSQRQIAAQFKEYVTQPAVANSLKLDRLMREHGLDSPYFVVAEPPKDYTKLRRYLNTKYRFQPEEGYQQRPL